MYEVISHLEWIEGFVLNLIMKGELWLGVELSITSTCIDINLDSSQFQAFILSPLTFIYRLESAYLSTFIIFGG